MKSVTVLIPLCLPVGAAEGVGSKQRRDLDSIIHANKGGHRQGRQDREAQKKPSGALWVASLFAWSQMDQASCRIPAGLKPN